MTPEGVGFLTATIIFTPFFVFHRLQFKKITKQATKAMEQIEKALKVAKEREDLIDRLIESVAVRDYLVIEQFLKNIENLELSNLEKRFVSTMRQFNEASKLNDNP